MSYPIAVLVGAVVFAVAGAWETAVAALVLAVIAVYVGDDETERGDANE